MIASQRKNETTRVPLLAMGGGGGGRLPTWTISPDSPGRHTPPACGRRRNSGRPGLGGAASGPTGRHGTDNAEVQVHAERDGHPVRHAVRLDLRR